MKSNRKTKQLFCRLFDTAIGSCGIAWNDKAIVRVQLPEHSPEATYEKLISYCNDVQLADKNIPAFAQNAMNKIQSHLDGNVQDLKDIPVDLDGYPQFHRRVYQALRMVPSGKVVSYAQLAEKAGSPLASRAVGQAMAHNPLAMIVPCHRVLSASGKLGGFSAYGGDKTKKRLLDIEVEDDKKALCRG